MSKAKTTPAVTTDKTVKKFDVAHYGKDPKKARAARRAFVSQMRAKGFTKAQVKSFIEEVKSDKKDVPNRAIYCVAVSGQPTPKPEKVVAPKAKKTAVKAKGPVPADAPKAEKAKKPAKKAAKKVDDLMPLEDGDTVNLAQEAGSALAAANEAHEVIG